MLLPTTTSEADLHLRDSEARYRFLADNSVDMTILARHDGTRVYVSSACQNLLGYTPEEMLQLNTRDTVHPDDAARLLALVGSTEKTPTIPTISYRMTRKDARYVWVEATGRIVDLPGHSSMWLVIVRDIEQRRIAEQQLKDSEERYRFLTDNSGDLIILVGHDGKRVYVSPVCQRMLGYTPDEMLQLNTRDTVHPEDAARLLAVLGSAELMRSTPAISYRTRHKDGRYIWVEATGRPVDASGQTGQRLVIIRDIEQRHIAEQQLKDSEARYRMLADNSSDLVFQLDRDLVRQYVSPACRELLGYEPEEMVSVKPVTMAHPDDAQRLALVFQTLLGGSAERQSIVNRIRHRDGRWIWVEAQLRALKSETGVVTGIVGALRDISARKATEDELAEANRRLKVLAAQDGLTGLANRRAFDEAMAKEHLRARREQTALALIMIDVDKFKAYNDLYGHPAGDECLRRVGGAIAATIHRPGDLAARYGGEEFAVLLPNTDEDGAALIAERISQAIVGLEIPHEANAHGIVTISGGVAATLPIDGTSEALVSDADRALYRAKDFGRNAVIRATEAVEDALAHASAAE